MTHDYEKLGAFYLGRRYDAAAGGVTDDTILYDAKDLTTHAICVGMTGSGKTGLGIALLEEAALDGVPAIIIDPKGDMGNLLLSFPSLDATAFRPWIDDSEAARKGRSADEHARWTAELWKNGLAEWGQDSERIARFRNAAECVIYTPGSGAGRQVKVLRAFSAPDGAAAQDPDAWRDRLTGTVTSLLALLGIDADPLRSREHILLSTIFDHRWREGCAMDLAALIRDVQKPPVDRVGVFDMESFFPEKDRFGLAMQLNNLVASPGFAAWTSGDPMNVGSLLFGPGGKPRLAIFSIAHLNDTERMFFVTLLLHEVIAWMRAQPGSRTLRALLYMDEIFGFFPPVQNPPSKAPMLTLLKQARAYGLGVVLATQNPVDLDYKGLSNCGTWFLGRLQTERDKARIIDGLEGASAAASATFDRAEIERTLSGLDSRVFLLNNVHEDEPVLFHTRWVLSYLAGPMTREQIRKLTPETAGPSSDAATAPTLGVAPPTGTRTPKKAPAATRPVLPASVPEAFSPIAGNVPGARYRPALLATATLHYAKSTYDVDEWRTLALIAPLPESATSNPWSESDLLEEGAPVLDTEPVEGIAFDELPKVATDPKRFKRWETMLKSHLYREYPLSIYRCKKPKVISAAGESEDAFQGKLREALREAREIQVEKLRTRYAKKAQTLRDRIRRAEERVERESAQLAQRKKDTAISFGTTVLGALFGRKLGSVGNVGRASTAMKNVGRTSREKDDVRRAAENLETLETQVAEVEQELGEKLEEIARAHDLDNFDYDDVSIAPRKSDMSIEQLTLVWVPEPSNS